MIITSAKNPLVVEVCRLHKASVRKEQNSVIIDGAREISLAIKAGWEIDRLFYCLSLVKSEITGHHSLFGLGQEKVIEVSEAVFKKICYKENAEGFLAVAKRRAASWPEESLTEQSLVLVLEKLEKPGNLGAIMRTAAAAGVAAIIINDNQTDIYNPNVIRASEGEVFNQVVVVSTKEETKDWLKRHKFKTIAAATNGRRSYTKVDLHGRLALVLGSEADGLGAFWLENADELVKIPMLSDQDSLNVSVSAAIIIFEALRQKGLI